MVDFLNLKTKQENPFEKKDHPVLAEITINGTTLHNIANGHSALLADGPLGIRFLLKNSFKVSNSNHVVKNMVMQIVALGKENTMTKEQIGVLTKIQKVNNVTTIKRKETKKVTESQLSKPEEY